MRHYLDFEKPIAELEDKIEELRHVSNSAELNIADEVVVPLTLRNQCRRLLAKEGHPLGRRRADEVAIAEWMDALYDVQDGLMFTIGDEDE